MKRSIWTRVLAMLLIVSMLTVPVSAAGWNSRSSGRGGWGWGSWGNFWEIWFGGEEEEPEPTEATEPETSSEAELILVEDYSTVDNGDLLRASTYALTTTEESETLSAAPYASVNAYGAVTTADDTSTTSTTAVKYFPVTMYDYDTNIINAATDAKDGDLTLREGIYFSNGSPSYRTETAADLSAFVAGQYYIQNIRAASNNVGSWLYVVSDDYSIRGTSNQRDATLWNLVIQDGQYYLTDENGDYLYVGTDGDTDGTTLTKMAINITPFSDDSRGVQLSQDGYYLCQWGSENSIYYGGYNVNNDGGNGMLFYPVVDGVVSDTPVVPGQSDVTVAYGYERWNRWDKGSGNNANGDLIYTGLAQQTMVDDQIVFNVPDGGIFNNDTSVKNIYEYVGLPFTFVNGKYTFDSDVNGAYFENGTPASGTADNLNNLYFDEGAPQPMPSGTSVGDGSTNAWLPYNTYTTSEDGTKTYNQNINYHFGMRADLPFSMTANGRVKSTDDSSAPIVFTFSGDDDVWVYVDGNLVIDLGGIHNRLDVTIDFAANTVTYSEENGQDTDNTTGSYNDSANFATTQKLFTDENGVGLINMTRDAFAAVEDHELQFFYLERGEGTSNCQIEFNLPMNDTVLVTKDATKSWSQAAEDADLEKDPNMENPGVDPLTDAEQAVVDAMNFGFTLYKKAVGDTAYAPVANTNYYLLNAAGERISIGSTDANGHFYLKNGQTAKFITDIPSTGVTYYVVEDKVPDGFVAPDFNFAGEAAYDYSYTGLNDGKAISGTASAADASQIPEQIISMPVENEDGTVTWAENKSYEVTVKGSIEANDSIEFICSNYMDATLPNPSIFTQEDIIVIDYGLPVQIDPLANDLFRANNQEILYVGGDNITLTTTTGEDGVVSATWTNGDALHSGTVELKKGTPETGDTSRDTLVYTLNKQLTEVEVLNYVVRVDDKTETAGESVLTQNAYAIGKIYIVPATIMYYEENFSDMVKFTGSNWVGEVTTEGKSDYQEPGVVGTTTDSTYGSDVAYLSDSKDSNGTSYYGDTSGVASGSKKAGAMKFEYYFTGTGSSFFARTSATTGYMQVKVYPVTYTTDASGNQEEKLGTAKTFYRDTYYEDTNESTEDAGGTLYNIPVFSTGDLEYGTYKIVVTVAKAGTAAAGGANGSGKDFYLDGIRVMQPLNEHVTGYDTDGEPIYDDITNKALGAYATDGEANIEVVTLRYKMITDAELETTPWNFVVLTDTNGEIETAETYESIGPKEEVYLDEGQTVSFALKYWELDGLMLYMGMKAPFGSAQVQVGKTTYNLANATDCYYDVTSNYSSLVTETDEEGNTYYVATFTFTSTDSIVSLTNIKVVGNYEFVIVEDVDVNVDGDQNDVDGEN